MVVLLISVLISQFQMPVDRALERNYRVWNTIPESLVLLPLVAVSVAVPTGENTVCGQMC